MAVDSTPMINSQSPVTGKKKKKKGKKEEKEIRVNEIKNRCTDKVLSALSRALSTETKLERGVSVAAAP